MAFFRGTGALLFLWKPDESEILLRSVYHLEGVPPPLDALELCAIASVGGCCDSVAIAASTQEAFFQSFLSMFCSPLEVSNLRRMRLFVCLVICCILDEPEKAHNLIVSALTTGRQALGAIQFWSESSEETKLYWKTAFRAVVFLESWFSNNTGAESRITQEDLAVRHSLSYHLIPS